MLKIVKKLFDWTPSDIAAWEKIRQRGLRWFMLWYGLAFSGIIFLVMGAVTLFSWLPSPASFTSLLFQLAVTASVCLLGGIITGPFTWWMEEHIYRKIMRSRPSQ